MKLDDNDSGAVWIHVEPVNVLSQVSESIKYVLHNQGQKLTIVCDILTASSSDRKEEVRFNHPNPPFSRFFIFKRGTGRVVTEAGETDMVPGKIYHLLPDQPFKVTYHANSFLIFFHLHITTHFGQNIFAEVKGIPTISDEELYERFVRAYDENDAFLKFSALTQSVGEFLKPHIEEITEFSSCARGFAPLFDYLEKTPPAAARISEIAELHHLTRDTLSKKFQRKMKVSLKQYLTDLTLKRAKKLLFNSDFTSQQIAAELGFSSPEYFYRFFKKYCGCTPKEFRQSSLTL